MAPEHAHTHTCTYTHIQTSSSLIKLVGADARSVSCLRHQAVFLLPLGISLRAPLHRAQNPKAVLKCKHTMLWRQHLENNGKHYLAGDGWTAWKNHIWGEITKDQSYGICCHKDIQPKSSWPTQSYINYLYIFLKIFYNLCNYIRAKVIYSSHSTMRVWPLSTNATVIVSRLMDHSGYYSIAVPGLSSLLAIRAKFWHLENGVHYHRLASTQPF